MLEELGVSVEGNFRGLVDEGWERKITQRVLKAEGITPHILSCLMYLAFS